MESYHCACKEELSCHALWLILALVILIIIPSPSFNMKFTLSVGLFLSVSTWAMISSIFKPSQGQLPLQVYLQLSMYFIDKFQTAFPVMASFNFLPPVLFCYPLIPISLLNQQSFQLLPCCQIHWSILILFFFLSYLFIYFFGYTMWHARY